MIKVLVVDDSSFMRKAITHILETDTEISVIDTAGNGEEAIYKTVHLGPDVILLDIDMPEMDGLTALSYIMENYPTSVLMISGLKDASFAIKALEKGAVDFIEKPSGVISYDIEEIGNKIIDKVKLAFRIDVSKILRPKEYEHPELIRPVKKKEIVVIGASTGGPRAILSILSKIPKTIKFSIIIVQHMSKEFIPFFAQRLQHQSAVSVNIPNDYEQILAGQIYIAPGGCHLSFIKEDAVKRMHFTKKKMPNDIYPSINYAMITAAQVYKDKTLGVILTGTGFDGAEGMKAIKNAGGNTISEDKSTSIAFGMPRAAIEIGVVDEIVPLPNIPAAILRMCDY